MPQTRVPKTPPLEATWLLRDSIVLGVKATSLYEPSDLVVPINQITQAILHLTVLQGDLDDEQWKRRLKAYNIAVYQIIHRLGRLPSAEHKLGTNKKTYLLNTDQWQLMREIKQSLDPTHTLNPGKIFDI